MFGAFHWEFSGENGNAGKEPCWDVPNGNSCSITSVPDFVPVPSLSVFSAIPNHVNFDSNEGK